MLALSGCLIAAYGPTLTKAFLACTGGDTYDEVEKQLDEYGGGGYTETIRLHLDIGYRGDHTLSDGSRSLRQLSGAKEYLVSDSATALDLNSNGESLDLLRVSIDVDRNHAEVANSLNVEHGGQLNDEDIGQVDVWFVIGEDGSVLEEFGSPSDVNTHLGVDLSDTIASFKQKLSPEGSIVDRIMAEHDKQGDGFLQHGGRMAQNFTEQEFNYIATLFVDYDNPTDISPGDLEVALEQDLVSFETRVLKITDAGKSKARTTVCPDLSGGQDIVYFWRNGKSETAFDSCVSRQQRDEGMVIWVFDDRVLFGRFVQDDDNVSGTLFQRRQLLGLANETPWAIRIPGGWTAFTQYRTSGGYSAERQSNPDPSDKGFRGVAAKCPDNARPDCSLMGLMVEPYKDWHSK